MKTARTTSSWLACLLSCVLPGAGLAYLGNWQSAAVNLAIAVFLPLLVLLTMPEEATNQIHYLILAIAVASGAFAHAKATQADQQP